MAKPHFLECASLALCALIALAAPALASASEVQQHRFRSAALHDEMHYTVYLPDGYAQGRSRYPVLYLLHGHGGNETDWLRHGQLQLTADRLIRSGTVSPFIVVMPGGGNDWWVDGARRKFQSALVDDLVAHIDGRFATLPVRAGRMIAGLSAGGYGTVMAALSHPERFAAAAALSPAVYEHEPPATSGSRRSENFATEGRFDPALWQRLSYPARWDAYRSSGQVVPIYLHSGDHDPLGIAEQTARLFQRLFEHQPKVVELRVVDGGHDWATWQAASREAIRFMSRHLMPMQSFGWRPGQPPATALRLAGIFGDHMVLQRDAPIRIWGFGPPGQTLRVAFRGERKTVTVDPGGRWQTELRAAPAGGPHELSVTGTRLLRVRDILVGDLWLSAGQSNMEWTLAQSQDAAREIAAADLPLIRHVKIEHRASLRPQDDGEPVSWQLSHPDRAGQFSAVAYYFARRMQRELGVPIGLVNASWGGSHIETWTSARAALADPDLAPTVRALPADAAAYAAQQRARMQALVQRWQGELALWALPVQPDWAVTELDDRAWPELEAPKIWEAQGLPGFDGTLWYRRRIELTPEQAAGAATLQLGAIDDCDETWLNGQRIGATCGWDMPRRYAVPAGVLRPGGNLIAVRVQDTGGGGGFHGDAAALRLQTAAGEVPLHGRWKARVEAPLAKSAPDFNDLPTLLFNGMVQPLTPLRLRGVLWYQGESNVPRAARYADAFARLIGDWRAHWGQPDLPFLYVQLASFLPLSSNSLQGSDWAELREAQRQALRVPGTGMVVATDLGDARDIHPRNKRPVGERLAALALRRVHGRAVVDSGPVLRSQRRVAGGAIELQFAPGSGALAMRQGSTALQGFAIAGADRRFVAAQATLRGDRVRIWSEQVPQPQAVRYGWVTNPEQSNLVNRAGLPASPFRTDHWPLLTRDARPEF